MLGLQDAPFALPATDLAIVVAYLLAVVAFGLWMSGRQRNADDYMVGGRNAPTWAVLLSIVATETSTVTFLSVPGAAFGGDSWTWLILPIGYIVGRLVVVAVLLPLYFEGRLYTAYQVLDQRFGGHVKRLASALFIVTRTLADGMRLYLSALVLHAVAGIPIAPAVIALGIATIVYTYVGGLTAVLWTDVVQFLVYMIGAAIAFGLMLGDIGGWSGLQAGIEARGDSIAVLDFAFDLNSTQNLWVALIGAAFLSIGTHGVDQLMVQRYLAAKDVRQAGWALALSGPIVALQMAFFTVIGLALWVWFQTNGPAPPETDRVFATFIVKSLPVGVLGLVLGAVFSAAMSTLSSSLNSCATTTVTDLLPESVRRDDRSALRATRTLTVVFGVLQIAVGIQDYPPQTPIIGGIFKVAGYTTGIVLGVFFLGIARRPIRQSAALVAMLGGLALMSWVAFRTSLAWPWFALIGSVSTWLFGRLVDRILPSGDPSAGP